MSINLPGNDEQDIEQKTFQDHSSINASVGTESLQVDVDETVELIAAGNDEQGNEHRLFLLV